MDVPAPRKKRRRLVSEANCSRSSIAAFNGSCKTFIIPNSCARFLSSVFYSEVKGWFASPNRENKALEGHQPGFYLRREYAFRTGHSFSHRTIHRTAIPGPQKDFGYFVLKT